MVPEPREATERIDLAEADDPRDVVHRAVACLAQGGVIGLPTDVGASVAVSALDPVAVSRLVAAPGASRLTVLLRGEDEAADWAPDLPDLARKVARRGWPGPIVLVLPNGSRPGLADRLPDPVRVALTAGGEVALRVPGPGLLREVLRLAPGPVVTRDGLDLGRVSLDMRIVEAGTAATSPPTAIRFGPGGWSVASEGSVSKAEVAAMAGTVWLFVCTGNTCRSPMAEALCKVLLAKTIGCRPAELLAKGHVVASTGVGASEGMPAASHAVEVVAARGGSLKGHASRQATAELLRKADLILALSGEHLDALLDLAPDVADRARMLDPDGLDIPDPIGSDRATYLETARAIEAHLVRLIDEMGP